MKYDIIPVNLNTLQMVWIINDTLKEIFCFFFKKSYYVPIVIVNECKASFRFFYAANLTAAKEKGGLVTIFRPRPRQIRLHLPLNWFLSLLNWF